jgi:molecular chaperone DnaK
MHLGIDFGTCNSSAAVMVDGSLRLVKEPSKLGYSFPSSVYLTQKGEILVGQLAENNRQLDVRRYRREFKRALGKNQPYLVGERSLTPHDLVTEVLKKLKTEAEKMLAGLGKGVITDAVATIPATYQQYKRDLMRQAAQVAGFTSVELLEEPVAAAIYYVHQNKNTFKEGEIILVYDLGGGTFDATLMKKNSTGYSILATPMGIENCGGADFDREIFRDLINRCSPNLRQQLKAKEEWRARSIVSDLCTDIKHHLSEVEEENIYIPIGQGESYQLTRKAFNQMIATHIENTIVVCDQLIESAGLKWQQIKQVLLVGGSCRIPYIKQAIKNKLGHSPLLVDEPELAVCQGAAIYKNLKAQSKNELQNVSLFKTLTRNIHDVSALAITPDGQTLVSASNDYGERITIWDLQRGGLLNTLREDSKQVLTLAISPDGETLVSGDEEGNIHSWHLLNGQKLGTFPFEGSIFALAMSPDGQFLVSSYNNGLIMILHLKTMIPLSLLPGNWCEHNEEDIETFFNKLGNVLTLAITPDGETLITGNSDSTIMVRSLKSLEVPRIISGHSDSVTTLVISPDGKTLVSGSSDYTINIWHLETGTLLSILTEHSSSVIALAISPDGETLVSGDEGGTINFWHLESRELLRNMTGHLGSVNTLAISPDGQTLVSGSSDNTIKIWRVV